MNSSKIPHISKEDFLKDFWGKNERVEVDAEALKELLQISEKQLKEIETIKADNTRLQAQVVYYRTNFMALQAKEPIYVNLKA